MISEDYVKMTMADWLKRQGYIDVVSRMGRANGIDVEGKDPASGVRLAIECKGENNAKNQWDNAWRNLSHALFNLIKDTEDPDNHDDIALAIPDTNDYRKRMDGLRAFCERQGITVYWVSASGEVDSWGSNS